MPLVTANGMHQEDADQVHLSQVLSLRRGMGEVVGWMCMGASRGLRAAKNRASTLGCLGNVTVGVGSRPTQLEARGANGLAPHDTAGAVPALPSAEGGSGTPNSCDGWRVNISISVFG